jgi:prepilin-type N-terminal cleavage/methylation domain-containing protein
MQINTKAFTLVEMLVAMAVSTIIIAATYASYDLVAKQYKKNLDVAEMHTSGRAIMQIIERDIRMAGFEYRATNAKITYGPISNPLVIKDSGNKCCDEVTVIYDYYDEDTKKVERIRSRYWTEAYTSNKGTRYRLNKRRDILGKNNAILATPILGMQSLMADFVEDLQLENTSGSTYLYTSDYHRIHEYDPTTLKWVRTIPIGYNPSNQSSIDIGEDGLIYALVFKNWKWAVAIINPTTGATSSIDSPGRNNRWAPGLGIAEDGFLYINTTAGGAVDVYDLKTKWRIKTITPSKQIVDLLSNKIDTNSSGMRCEAKYGHSGFNCTNPSNSFGHNGNKYTTIKFGYGGTLYAARDYRGASIDVFDVSSGYIGEIKVGKGGQVLQSRTYGIATLSNIKTSSTVNISLVLRTRNEYGKDRQFKKKDYHSGNFKFDKNDKYKRDTFSSKVLVRNMAL